MYTLYSVQCTFLVVTSISAMDKRNNNQFFLGGRGLVEINLHTLKGLVVVNKPIEDLRERQGSRMGTSLSALNLAQRLACPCMASTNSHQLNDVCPSGKPAYHNPAYQP